MSGRQMARPGQRVRGARPVSVLPVFVATLFHVESASAQLFQWTPEQLIRYTNKNPYDRFPDGKPKVHAGLLQELAADAGDTREPPRSHACALSSAFDCLGRQTMAVFATFDNGQQSHRVSFR